MNLFIGSSSSNGIPEKYFKDCKNYLDCLFKKDNNLVFGACKDGLMGISYESALKFERKISAMVPEQYKDDLNGLNCTKKIVTRTISDRTNCLIENCDAIIFLPGGIGTIYELFTAIECKRSYEFNKPIIIYNSCGFYDELLTLLDKIYNEKFTSSKVKNNYHVSNSIEDTLEFLRIK